jgi:glycosyltransferase involved in cell wall biosynthesis
MDKIAQRIMSSENKMPLISVIMPVYNCEKFVAEAVESVIGQTERNWELIILDDGSTDNSLKVLEALRDPRIQVIASGQNRGLSYQMNTGISLARGEFIAIAHADDINEPTRFSAQLDRLEKDPSIGVLGTWVKFFGARQGVGEFPVDPADCRVLMLDYSPIANPTAMVRKSLLDQLPSLYRQDLVAAEDYDLWERLIALTSFANLPQPLVHYRIHSMQNSQRKRAEEFETALIVKRNFVENNFKQLDQRDKDALYSILALQPGGFISRAAIRAGSRLPAELYRCSGIEAAKWRRKLQELLWYALISGKNYEAGAGTLFFFLNPGAVFSHPISDCFRVVLRSF